MLRDTSMCRGDDSASLLSWYVPSMLKFFKREKMALIANDVLSSSSSESSVFVLSRCARVCWRCVMYHHGDVRHECADHVGYERIIRSGNPNIKGTYVHIITFVH